jgi:hypothetical protein
MFDCWHETKSAAFSNGLSQSEIARATVLGGKLKVNIFKEVVHEDDEFAHASGHGDQRLFTSGTQTLIKIFEDKCGFRSGRFRPLWG